MRERQLDPSEMVHYYETPFYRQKYAEERTRLSDFFPSERRFLERVARPGMAVLDVGCACGGLLNALQELVSDVHYVGVGRLTPALSEVARLRHPQATFLLADASEGLPVPPLSFDLVTAFGVSVHEPRYRDVLAAAYTKTKQYLLYDVRIQAGGEETSDIATAHVVNASGARNHYVVTPYREVVSFACDLRPRPSHVEIFGYYSSVGDAKTVTLPDGATTVCTAAVLIERESRESKHTILEVEHPPDIVGCASR